MNLEEAKLLSVGDKLQLKNLSDWDIKRGFVYNEIVTFVKLDYEILDTKVGLIPIIYFKDKKQNCEFGHIKYFKRLIN